LARPDHGGGKTGCGNTGIGETNTGGRAGPGGAAEMTSGAWLGPTGVGACTGALAGAGGPVSTGTGLCGPAGGADGGLFGMTAAGACVRGSGAGPCRSAGVTEVLARWWCNHRKVSPMDVARAATSSATSSITRRA
jgi:hypothetical protein